LARATTCFSHADGPEEAAEEPAAHSRQPSQQVAEPAQQKTRKQKTKDWQTVLKTTATIVNACPDDVDGCRDDAEHAVRHDDVHVHVGGLHEPSAVAVGVAAVGVADVVVAVVSEHESAFQIDKLPVDANGCEDESEGEDGHEHALLLDEHASTWDAPASVHKHVDASPKELHLKPTSKTMKTPAKILKAPFVAGPTISRFRTHILCLARDSGRKAGLSGHISCVACDRLCKQYGHWSCRNPHDLVSDGCRASTGTNCARFLEHEGAVEDAAIGERCHREPSHLDLWKPKGPFETVLLASCCCPSSLNFLWTQNQQKKERRPKRTQKPKEETRKEKQKM
jgi:hypothetical protein